MADEQKKCPDCGRTVREVTERVTSWSDPVGDPIAVAWHCDSCGWDWRRDDGSWSPFGDDTPPDA